MTKRTRARLAPTTTTTAGVSAAGSIFIAPQVAALHSAALVVALILTSTGAISIDQAILDDVLGVLDSTQPATAGVCDDPQPTTTTTNTSFNTSWPAESGWRSYKQQYEEDNFLVEMAHDDPNDDLDWYIRLGSGGNIYSFQTSVGELNPAQITKFSTFVDDMVQMCVGVDQSLANVYQENMWYVHQGGTYQRDYNEPRPNDANTNGEEIIDRTVNNQPFPFYSPTLAHYCDGNTCSTASWGQQARVKTQWKSGTLFFSKFRNCGSGVIELVEAIQNAAPSSSLYKHDLLNIHWGGVRATTMPELFLTNRSGYRIHETKLPLIDFNGESRNFIKTLETTGGYFVHSERINITDFNSSYPMPCYKSSNASVLLEYRKYGCNQSDIDAGFVRLSLEMVTANSCSAFNDPERSASDAPDTNWVACSLVDPVHHPTIPNLNTAIFWDNKIAYFVFKNKRTNATVPVRDVRHWNYENKMIFSVASSWGDEDTFNTMFSAGDEIDVNLERYPGVAETDAFAFATVHGKLRFPVDDGRNGGERDFRFGDTTRDFYVATTRVNQATLTAGDTFISRQYFAIDRLPNIEAKVANLIDDATSEYFAQNEFNGRSIELYADFNDEIGVFGAAAADEAGGNTTSCLQGQVICSGSSTPGVNLIPFYSVKCFDTSQEVHYFGSDPYGLCPSPSSEMIVDEYGNILKGPLDIVRSYRCNGFAAGIKPELKLMGYFSESEASCAQLEAKSYDDTFCDRRAHPTDIPNSSPSGSPTSPAPSASPAPSGDPSTSPKPLLSSAPSTSPSVFLSDFQSSAASLTVSEEPIPQPALMTPPMKKLRRRKRPDPRETSESSDSDGSSSSDSDKHSTKSDEEDEEEEAQ